MGLFDIEETVSQIDEAEEFKFIHNQLQAAMYKRDIPTICSWIEKIGFKRTPVPEMFNWAPYLVVESGGSVHVLCRGGRGIMLFGDGVVYSLRDRVRENPRQFELFEIDETNAQQMKYLRKLSKGIVCESTLNKF